MSIEIFTLHGVQHGFHQDIFGVAKQLTASECVNEEVVVSVVGNIPADKWEVSLDYPGGRCVRGCLYMMDKTPEKLKMLLAGMLTELSRPRQSLAPSNS